jgi:hypothetical protein
MSIQSHSFNTAAMKSKISLIINPAAMIVNSRIVNPALKEEIVFLLTFQKVFFLDRPLCKA